MAKKRIRKISKRRLENMERRKPKVMEEGVILHQLNVTRYDGLGWNIEKNVGAIPEFKSAPELLERFLKYCDWNDKNLYPNPDMRIKRGVVVDLNEQNGLRIPYSLVKFCHYCGMTYSWFKRLRVSATLRKPDFLAVIHFMEETVRENKLNGAIVGVYNPKIVAQDLGLIDRVQNVDNKEEIRKKFPFAKPKTDE